ncbi:MAG: TolB family protein [Gemmatimonadaceae bacterium]
MHTPRFAAVAIVATAVLSCGPRAVSVSSTTTTPVSIRTISPTQGETHFGTIRQLTYGGENAEAYFSPDGDWLIFQSTRDGRTCDQQYVVRSDGSGLRRVSDGTGKTTCGYFIDGGRRIVYASTHAADTACPPRPDPSRGYVWGLDPFDLYTANPDGSNRRRLTSYGVYTAEATLSPDGQTLVFTSLKDGDLELYTMNVDGTNIRRLTNTPGYDGGAFFSPDGKMIVYRAHHPTGSDLVSYRELLGQRLIRPNRMELFVMNADGSNQRQITSLGGANFAPIFTPDSRRIIFSSNHKNPRSRNFDLYLVNLDGSGLEQVTTHPEFDGFPMFSPDGGRLVWASNRNAPSEGGTDIFLADWRP